MRIKLSRPWAGFVAGKIVSVSDVRGAYLVRLGFGENLDAPADVPAIDPADTVEAAPVVADAPPADPAPVSETPAPVDVPATASI